MFARKLGLFGNWGYSGGQVYNPRPIAVCRLVDTTRGDSPTMRRFLIALTLVLLLTVSIGVGILVADWPHWRRVLFP